MARKDRTGERRQRDQRKNLRVPELGYYLIVTDLCRMFKSRGIAVTNLVSNYTMETCLFSHKRDS